MKGTVIRSGYLMRRIFDGDATIVRATRASKQELHAAAMAQQAPLPIALPVHVQPPLMALPESALRPLKLWKTRGHAARPGTGPAGETCGSCASYRSVQGGTRCYPKCELRRSSWTGGPGSDIRKRDPACERWSAKQDKPL